MKSCSLFRNQLSSSPRQSLIVMLQLENTEAESKQFILFNLFWCPDIFFSSKTWKWPRKIQQQSFGIRWEAPCAHPFRSLAHKISLAQPHSLVHPLCLHHLLCLHFQACLVFTHDIFGNTHKKSVLIHSSSSLWFVLLMALKAQIQPLLGSCFRGVVSYGSNRKPFEF